MWKARPFEEMFEVVSDEAAFCTLFNSQLQADEVATVLNQLAAAREREKQLRERAESGDAAVAMCNRWYEAAMTHYPLNWAVEPGNPELVIGNIVRNIEDGHRALLAEAHKDIAATIERAERAEDLLSVYRSARAVNGLCGRPWMSAQHSDAEDALHKLNEPGSTEWHTRKEAAMGTDENMEVHKPTVVDIGPGAVQHDQACAICYSRPAVYQCNEGIFKPCWICQDTWETRRKGWLDRMCERLFVRSKEASDGTR